VAPERLVYFDHRCAECQLRRVTRLHQGVYVCETCLKRQGVEIREEELPTLVPTKLRRRWRRRLRTVEGSGP
jgi:hypothetical protein